MSKKIHLGKTRDSRSRAARQPIIKVAEQERLLEELKNQQEFTQYLLLKGYSTTTIKRYVKDTELFIKWTKQENIPIEQVSYSDILHYIQGKKNRACREEDRAIKQSTISSNINSLKHYFNFLALTNQKLENPTTSIQIKGIKRRSLYHTLNKQELESLYNNFEIPDENHKDKNQNWFKKRMLASKRNKVILGMIIYQGLGTLELGRLEMKDIKLREGKIYIVGTRRSNERTMKLEAHQMLDIMEYTLQLRPDLLKFKNDNYHSDLLFVSTGVGDYFGNIIKKLIKKLNKQNSKITSVKQIRTSVIVHWLKNYNLREVQYLAGHRYVSSTEAYLINDLEDLTEDIAKFHPIG